MQGNSSVKMANVSVAGTGEGDSAMEVDWDGTGQAVSPKNDVTPRDFQNEVFSNDLVSTVAWNLKVCYCHH